ncbi:MAG: glycosyltransferase [Candidatus Gracilibacteria bacterium]
MDLSIVILHHGNPQDVSKNLEALTHAILPAKTEVIVVNNGYSGANAGIPFERNLKFDLRFFEIKNKGYSNGNNFGINITKGQYICILNPDIEVEKDTFRVLLAYLKAHPRVGIAGPRLYYADGQVQDNYRMFPRPLDHFIKRTILCKIFTERMRKYLMWDKDPKRSEPVDWLTGAFQIITRKAWNKIGPNDERFFLFMSDVDLCRQAWNRGFEVHFVGSAGALHRENRLSGGGLVDVFKKKTVRTHFWDALKYYLKYNPLA